MFENINKACDPDRPVQRPAANPDPEDPQAIATAARSSLSDATPRPSRKIRAQTEGMMTSPNSKADKQLRKERKARALFQAGSKEKLPELPSKFKLNKPDLSAGHNSSVPGSAHTPGRAKSSKRGRSVVDSEEMANNLTIAELLAERCPPLLDSDDESIPATPAKRLRTKSPKGKGRADPVDEESVQATAPENDDAPENDQSGPITTASERARLPKGKGKAGPVAAQPVQITASDEDDEVDEGQAKSSAAASPCTKSPKGKNRADIVQQSAHESASADPYDFSDPSDSSDSSASSDPSSSSEDEDEEQTEQVAGASQDEGDSAVESHADETLDEPIDRRVVPMERMVSPDLASEDDVANASTVYANVPAAKTKKQKRKRTAKPDVEDALPGSSTSDSSSPALDDVQSPPKKLKKNKNSKGDHAATTNNDTGEGSRDLPAAESSTLVASADQQSISAKQKNKKDKSTYSAAIVDNTIADAAPSETPAGESSASAALPGETSLPGKKKGKKAKSADTSVNADAGSFVGSPAESSTDAQRRHKLEVKNGKKRKNTDARETAQQAQSEVSGDQPSQEVQAEKKVKKSKKKATSSDFDTGSFIENPAESSADAQRRHKLEVKNGKKNSTQGNEAHATLVESQATSSADVLGPLESSLAKQAKVCSVSLQAFVGLPWRVLTLPQL